MLIPNETVDVLRETDGEAPQICSRCDSLQQSGPLGSPMKGITHHSRADTLVKVFASAEGGKEVKSAQS
jgi:hypothetical protein